VALEVVLAGLPAGFAVPILVVQHIASGFLDGLVDWLDDRVALPVARAFDGSSAAPGVWFAPEGVHLVLDDRMHTRFDTQSVAGYHRPAADVLLCSVARVARQQAVSVVLTGMGSDGASGTAAIRGAGGLTIAQDRASSLIYGMPRAAAEAGAEIVLPLDAIGATLSRLLPVGVAV
jgi:two-component system chemotaxis response regulator CheB